MIKYEIIFALNNGLSVTLPEEDYKTAVKAAKALIKLDIVSLVTLVNTETKGSTIFYNLK